MGDDEVGRVRINLGSGQRKFGYPRPIWRHDKEPDGVNFHGKKHPCVCGIDFWSHDGAMRSSEHPHRYVPDTQSAWLNVDCNSKWEPDAWSLNGIDDGVADITVLHHVIEHVGCGESAPLLKECRRVLKEDGSIIICVPDMRALATAYLQGRMSTQLYMTNVYGAYMDNEADRHRWGFDFVSLRDLLYECGFSRIKPFDWRGIPGSSIARDWWVLAVESIK